MNPTEYTKGVLRTCAPEKQKKIPIDWRFLEAIKNVEKYADVMDKYKKLTFYNRPIHDDYTGPVESEHDADNVFHAILGIITEAGELCEVLKQKVANGTVDKTNLLEEIGDCLWYIALGIHASGSSFEEVMQTNIDKLRKRYPEKFTEAHANVRDLAGEREVLDGGFSRES